MKFTRKTVAFVVLLSAVVQTAIILFNYYTGYISISGVSEFGVRLLTGTVFSAIVCSILLYMDMRLIAMLDRSLPWQSDAPLRTVIELPVVAVIGGILGIGVTMLAQSLFPYREDLHSVIVTNTAIAAVINIILATAIEAAVHYRRSREIKQAAEKLERENVLMRFEVLKKQLDPHFLFNSLNVLSSLIRNDPDSAQHFVDEFSSIYRYTLEVIDRPLVTVREELTLVESYLYMQNIRFGDGVHVRLDFGEETLSLQIPPLALQTLLENALKHNIATSENPLDITIASSGDTLRISNTLQPKHSSGTSVGIGLENLRKRCLLTSGHELEVRTDANEWTVILPLTR